MTNCYPVNFIVSSVLNWSEVSLSKLQSATIYGEMNLESLSARNRLETVGDVDKSLVSDSGFRLNKK